MVSRTALICKRYAAGCTKTEPKILRPKNKEKEKNAPEIVRKGRNRVRFGCWREVQPVRKGTRTRSPNQNAPHSHATHEKSKPAKTQCFRRFCGRGRRTCLGCRLGRFAAERHWRSLTPRHALRRAQPCLVAESLCALTKNREASIVLASLFLAGQKDLNPRHAVLEWMWKQRTRNRKGAALPGSPVRSSKVWCWFGALRTFTRFVRVTGTLDIKYYSM